MAKGVKDSEHVPASEAIIQAYLCLVELVTRDGGGESGGGNSCSGCGDFVVCPTRVNEDFGLRVALLA